MKANFYSQGRDSIPSVVADSASEFASKFVFYCIQYILHSAVSNYVFLGEKLHLPVSMIFKMRDSHRIFIFHELLLRHNQR